jgi:hypothetical protein
MWRRPPPAIAPAKALRQAGAQVSQSDALIRLATPDDAPFVAGITGVDARDYMARSHTLISKNGFFFLEPITTSVLEAHMAFLRPGRGRECLHAARAGLRYAFAELGALVIFGRIPVEDRAARLLTRIIGLRPDGIRPREPGGPLCEWFEIRRDMKVKA